MDLRTCQVISVHGWDDSHETIMLVQPFSDVFRIAQDSKMRRTGLLTGTYDGDAKELPLNCRAKFPSDPP